MPEDERRRMSGKEVARMDARNYDEPERDLRDTKPVDAGDVGGGRGDVDNPVADTGIPGSIGETENKFGRNEQNKLAKGKNA